MLLLNDVHLFTHLFRHPLWSWSGRTSSLLVPSIILQSGISTISFKFYRRIETACLCKTPIYKAKVRTWLDKSTPKLKFCMYTSLLKHMKTFHLKNQEYKLDSEIFTTNPWLWFWTCLTTALQFNHKNILPVGIIALNQISQEKNNKIITFQESVVYF